MPTFHFFYLLSCQKEKYLIERVFYVRFVIKKMQFGF